jgi:hypothetical protein
MMPSMVMSRTSEPPASSPARPRALPHGPHVERTRGPRAGSPTRRWADRRRRRRCVKGSACTSPAVS